VARNARKREPDPSLTDLLVFGESAFTRSHSRYRHRAAHDRGGVVELSGPICGTQVAAMRGWWRRADACPGHSDHVDLADHVSRCPWACRSGTCGQV